MVGQRLLVLPDDLSEESIDLQEISIAELAWSYPVIIRVIRYAADHGHVLLGGDVFKMENGSPAATGDSWYTNAREGISRAELIELSETRAEKYVEAYHSRNGEGFIYSIVLDDVETVIWR